MSLARWALVALLALGACTGGEETSEPTATPSRTVNDTSEGPSKAELVENNRDLGRRLCGRSTREELAADFGGNPDDPESIARAYSMGYREGPHRDAAYAGCLEGLMETGEGGPG